MILESTHFLPCIPNFLHPWSTSIGVMGSRMVVVGDWVVPDDACGVVVNHWVYIAQKTEKWPKSIREGSKSKNMVIYGFYTRFYHIHPKIFMGGRILPTLYRNSTLGLEFNPGREHFLYFSPKITILGLQHPYFIQHTPYFMTKFFLTPYLTDTYQPYAKKYVWWVNNDEKWGKRRFSKSMSILFFLTNTYVPFFFLPTYTCNI